MDKQRSPWSAAVFAALLFVPGVRAQQDITGLARPGTARVEDRLRPLPPGAVRFGAGLMGDRMAANRARLLAVDETDLLDAFERRDVDHQVWQGEHAGKFLHSAALTWAATGDPALKAKCARVARRLVATQEPDGYLGTYAPAQRWTAWDVWVHKYDILGLLAWHQYSGDAESLAGARRAADLLLRIFGPGGRDLNKAGEHVGMAATSVLEPMCLLYRVTGDARYLHFARRIVDGYDNPGGPRVLSGILGTGRLNRVANGKAYEMLSNVAGLVELYRITGEMRFRHAAETAWDDAVARRLYITGTASAGEHFRPDFELPNRENANIGETCVTVTWLQLNMHLLRLTGSARYAEQIERTAYNHLFGAQSADGRRWCYYTALEGRKPYGDNTTCCLSSGPRGVALLRPAAAMAGKDGGLSLNLYNTGTVEAGGMTLDVRTQYPYQGRVDVTVARAPGKHSTLRMRIPAWAAGATARVNGAAVPGVVPGEYLALDRRWETGDTVRLDFPLRARLVKGDHGNDGKGAACWGPLVLALDTGLNPDIRLTKSVAFASDADTLDGRWTRLPGGRMAFSTAGTVGADTTPRTLLLAPFAEAGLDGESRYLVWIARSGRAETGPGSGSLFYGGVVGFPRPGNQNGDIADDDPETFRVTWNMARAAEDWYSVSLPTPVTISRVVFMHGRVFNNGGWFDASAGKPRIQVQSRPGAEWVTVAVLESYPATTATDAKGLSDGQAFSVTFPPVEASAVRILGVPAHGDQPSQNFTSCAELQAFPPGP